MRNLPGYSQGKQLYCLSGPQFTHLHNGGRDVNLPQTQALLVALRGRAGRL